MKGDRKQYRVMRRVEWPCDYGDTRETVSPDKRCKAGSLADAKRRLLAYGPEPWLAFGKGPDDEWCCAKTPCLGFAGDAGEEFDGCPAEHVTAREFFTRQREEMFGKVIEAWIEERVVSPWHRFDAAMEGGKP